MAGDAQYRKRIRNPEYQHHPRVPATKSAWGPDQTVTKSHRGKRLTYQGHFSHIVELRIINGELPLLSHVLNSAVAQIFKRRELPVQSA